MLSKETRANCPAPNDANCNCGWAEYADEVIKLEEEKEQQAQTIVDCQKKIAQLSRQLEDALLKAKERRG